MPGTFAIDWRFIAPVLFAIAVSLFPVGCGGPGPVGTHDPIPVFSLSAYVTGESRTPPFTVVVDIAVSFVRSDSLRINWGDSDEWVSIPLDASRLNHVYEFPGTFNITLRALDLSGRLIQEKATVILGEAT